MKCAEKKILLCVATSQQVNEPNWHR